MHRISIAALLLVLALAPYRANGADTTRSDLTNQLYAAKLGQLALLVKDLSQGKSRLAVGQVSSDGPKVGRASRSREWGDLPFASVWPASKAFRARTRIGECIVIGAISLLVQAEPAGARDSTALGRIPMAPPGVYLLAYTGGFADEENESGVISLLSVSVDNDGNPAIEQIIGLPAIRHTRPANVDYGGQDWFGASVLFPNKDQVSKDYPAWRAKVLLAPHEPDGRYRSYSFELDLEITTE